MSQRKYVLEIVNDARMIQAKGATSSMDPGAKLLPEGVLMTNPDQYRQVVGKVNYLAVMTRLDTSFTVSVASRFMAFP